MGQPLKNDLIGQLRKNGIRITPQLEAILEYITSTREHPTAQRIYEVVRKRVSRISLATVYNVLSKLRELNLVTVLEFNEMENRYDGDTSPHWNLVCVECGKIFDYRPVYTIDKEQVKKATRFEVFQTRFELYGLCRECSRRWKKDSLKGVDRIQNVSSRKEAHQ